MKSKPHLRIYTGIVSNEQATNAEEIENYDFDLVNNEINYEINQPISENEYMQSIPWKQIKQRDKMA